MNVEISEKNYKTVCATDEDDDDDDDDTAVLMMCKKSPRYVAEIIYIAKQFIGRQNYSQELLKDRRVCVEAVWEKRKELLHSLVAKEINYFVGLH